MCVCVWGGGGGGVHAYMWVSVCAFVRVLVRHGDMLFNMIAILTVFF